MGRHSASDDEPDDAADVATASLDLGSSEPEVPRGRHARHGAADAAPSGADEQRTQMIAVVDPEADFGETHGDTQITDVIVPPPDFVPLAAAPAEPSKADRKAAAKAATKAAKAAKAEAKAAAKAAAQPEPKTEPEPKAKTPAEPKTKKKRDGETDTQADLRVLRENSAVRARSIAAVLVSFLLYTIVMIVIGRTEVYLLWIWIPIVVAGVLVGVVLDMAHRPPRGSEPAPPLEPMG